MTIYSALLGVGWFILSSFAGTAAEPSHYYGRGAVIDISSNSAEVAEGNLLSRTQKDVDSCGESRDGHGAYREFSSFYTESIPMAVGDSFNQFENLLRESLDETVLRLSVEADDPIWSLLQTMRNVKKLGRITGAGTKTKGDPGYEARWEVLMQRGGTVTGASIGETSSTLMGPNSGLIMGLGTNSQGLDPVDTPQRSYLELVSFLKKAKGQVTLNADQLEAKLIGSPVEDVAMGYIEDATFQVRDLITSLSWGAGDGVMAWNADGTETIAEDSINWVTVDNGSPFRFTKGQKYVAADQGTNPKCSVPRAGTLTSPGVFRCVGVNPITREVGFQSEPGQGNIVIYEDDLIIRQGMWDFTTAATSATDNTPSLAPNGIENLLINTGAFPDSDITDVTDYPELQAYITDNTGSEVTPEPERLDEILDLMTGPGGPDDGPPPILIAENSVWTLWSHLERRAMAMYPVTQTFTSGGGVTGPVYTYGSRSFQRLSSSKCRESTIFGIDPSTFIRFMPNDLTLRWKMTQGGLSGMGGIFRGVYEGRSLTSLAAADFELWWQMAQTRPLRNFILKGVHSQRTYTS